MASIGKSVGQNGSNEASDVKTIQELLNRNRHLLIPLPSVPENGVIDAATITAIETFQRRVALLNPPDGVIDPGGGTLAKLNENARTVGVTKLPLFPLKRRPTASYKSGGRQFAAPRSGGRLHAACDLLEEEGAEVMAMDDGIIVQSPYDFYDGTIALEVDHGNYIVRYGELRRAAPGLIAAGVKVKRGDVIGFVGRLSTSGASMLHIEIYSGTQTGSLTDRRNLPFQRRSDLLDPTDFLDIATFDTPSSPSIDGQRVGRVSSRVSTVLNLRRDADPASVSLAQLNPGATVKILDVLTGKEYDANGVTRKDWFEVDFGGQRGFVAAFYIDLEFQVGRVSSRVQSQLNLRESPSTSAPVIAGLSPGTNFKILEREVGSSYDVGGTSRNDWFESEYNGKRGFVAAFYVDVIATPDNENDPNIILFTYEPTGASDRTANQDGLPARGITEVKASEAMAETDWTRIKAHKDKFKQAGRALSLPPALLAAIASRESRGGNVLDRNGFGDGGNAFGIMQVDKRFHRVVLSGGSAGQDHIDQATEILKDKLKGVEIQFPSLTDSMQLQTAVSRYNGGNGFAAPNSDQGTTGGDYMNDVWARARYYAKKDSWD